MPGDPLETRARSWRAAFPLVLGLCGLASTPLGAAEESADSPLPTLTKITAVRNLSPEEAARPHPLRVEGVITYSEPNWRIAFVQDDSVGLFVNIPSGVSRPPTGARVVINGVSGPGNFAPVIVASEVSVLGTIPLPTAKRVAFAQLLTGQEDSQFVEAQGIVRSITLVQNGFMLKVANETGQFEVRIPATDNLGMPNHLIDAEVHFQGVAGALFNNQRQSLGLRLFVPSLDQVRVSNPGPSRWDQIPSQAVAQLLRFNLRLSHGHRTRVSGMVTAVALDGSLFLQDESGAVLVRVASPGTNAVGESIEAAGFPAISDLRPILEDATIRSAAKGSAVSVRMLDPDNLPPSLDGKLASITGRLWQSWALTGTEYMLVLQASNRIFIATLPARAAAAPPPGYKIGSTLRLTGVFWPKRGEGRKLTTPQLLLRSPGDVELIRAPSWWNVKRTFIVIGVLVGAHIFGVFSIGALRRQVSAKTKQIEEYARERESLLERRFSDLVENANDLIFTLDHTGRFTSFNKAGQDALGYSRDEVLQMNLGQVVAPEHQDLAGELLRPRNGTGTHCLGWVSKTGQRKLIDVSARSIPEAGGLHSIQCIGRDITEQERIKRDLARERDLLDAFMENTPDRVYFKDRDSRFVRCSKSLAEFFKLAKPTEATGKTDFDFFSKEHAQPAFDDEQRILRTGESVLGLVEKETWPDGRTSWSLTSKMPWRDERGETIGIFGVSKDITALKSTEAALAYEKDLLAAFLDNIPDAVYFKDRSSRFVRCSRSLARFFGLPFSADAIGKTDFDFFAKDHAQPAFDDEQRIIQTGQAVADLVEKELWPDGRITWALTTKMPWRDERGEIIGTFGVSKNITALKQAEEKLEQTHKLLMTASRQAGMAEVATSVLHNVGNVLNSVNISASLLTETLQKTKLVNLSRAASLLAEHCAEPTFLTENERGRHLPGYLQQLASHLMEEREQMTSELRSLADHIAHIKHIVMMQQSYALVAGVTEKVKIGELVEDAIRMNNTALNRHEIQMFRQIEADPEIVVDKHLVLQILVNLIRNSKQACDEGPPSEKRLTIRIAELTAGRVAVQVIDNGVGIAPENAGRIFTQGFTTRRDGHGFGLHGSAIAAAEIGGTLSFASDGLGKGATFTLDLPLTPPKPN